MAQLQKFRLRQPNQTDQEPGTKTYYIMDVGVLSELLDRIGVSSIQGAQIANATTSVFSCAVLYGFVVVRGEAEVQEVPSKMIFVAKKIEDKRVKVRTPLIENLFSNLPTVEGLYFDGKCDLSSRTCNKCISFCC